MNNCKSGFIGYGGVLCNLGEGLIGASGAWRDWRIVVFRGGSICLMES